MRAFVGRRNEKKNQIQENQQQQRPQREFTRGKTFAQRSLVFIMHIFT